ncbi:hypothetical protein [Glycomyces buryatensis]|uniref:PE domain-containing protein n=1 Tax=Glycomyces buryatensis TaxID=2570927 RepID=A0A4S8QCB7_9ACTN|nr:hypothetical protein [Glycomyces buryatensis]THV40515.1 hypothetical protein FAB82_14680 [Glycomyces buryatensis]
MTEILVDPEGMQSWADGSTSLAEKFGDLATLLEQARVNDECFGPIGEAVGLAGGYFESLDSCQEMAETAQSFLEFGSEAVSLCAAEYGVTDDAMAKVFDTLSEMLGEG